MKSIGIDLVEIDRIQAMTEKYGERFLDRVFTKQEISYCRHTRRGFRHNSLAARFAAKEAFYKAANPLLGHAILWHDCEIISDNREIPRIVVTPALKEALGNPVVHLSLSHTHKYAVAVVVID